MAVFFALLGALGAGACDRGAQTGTVDSKPDLVLVTIDTLRADRVGRGLTPALDGLAASGVQFTEARAAVPLTLPSHVSILTGELPPVHGVRENGIHVFRGKPSSVARQLKGAGYRTAAFVGAYVLDRRFGLADGFDHYDDQIRRDRNAPLRLETERPANEVVDRAIAWLRGVRAHPERDQTTGPHPVFVWVHLYDPHAPYKGSYDDEVKFADAQVGRLLQEVRTAGRDPLVVAAGDHGESLGEHGEQTHGMLLYDAALRVPLIVAGSGIAHARRADPVALVDVAPTLLARAGIPSTSGAGRDLLVASVAGREIYSETQYPRVAGWSPVYALLQDRWKLVVSRSHELYDLATDPSESANIAAARQSLVNAMAARINEVRSSPGAATRAVATPEVAERLRALGYVAASSVAPKPGDAPNPADHVAAWGEFEAALSMLGRPGNRSVPILKKLAEAYPDAPVFQSTYARALADGGSMQAALAIYRRAVARWPNDATLFHELAVAARTAGRAEEAKNAEEAAIALEPHMASAHNGIGLLMTDAERHDDARLAFERAVAGDPTNAEYWVNLGNARRAVGAAEGAADAYRRAAELDPRSADAANGLGVLLVQQHRAAEAIAWFERALQTSPDFIEARLNLAIAYQESGQRDRARQAYRDVLAHAPASAPERRAATDLLRSLER